MYPFQAKLIIRPTRAVDIESQAVYVNNAFYLLIDVVEWMVVPLNKCGRLNVNLNKIAENCIFI